MKEDGLPNPVSLAKYVTEKEMDEFTKHQKTMNSLRVDIKDAKSLGKQIPKRFQINPRPDKKPSFRSVSFELPLRP